MRSSASSSHSYGVDPVTRDLLCSVRGARAVEAYGYAKSENNRYTWTCCTRVGEGMIYLATWHSYVWLQPPEGLARFSTSPT